MKAIKLLLAVFVSVVMVACGGGGSSTPPAAPTAPSAPIIGAASAGDAQATVSFSSPASNGGSAITSYTVTSSPGNKTATGSSSPLVVTGLTNGTAYSFTVTAKNSVGTSPTSAASNPVIPVATPPTVATVPDAPIIGTATAGNANASVTFAPPANNGGSAITSYTVTSAPGNFIATGTASPLTVTGLANGTAYTFTVKATNVIGNSVASAASNSVTPIVPPTAPGAPTGAVASLGAAGTRTASVTFAAPTTGTTPFNYTVTSSPAGGVDAHAGTTALTHTMTNLTIGQSYTFTVKASNSVGAGTASAPSNAVTPLAAVPSAPASASAAAGNAQAMVSFTASASNGGSPITSYTATSTPGGFTASGLSSPLTVTGLANGTSYTFAVKANNVAGSSASVTTNAVTPVAPPPASTVSGVPTAVSAVAGNTQASVSFTAPANNGGSAITLYTVTSSGGQTGSGTASPIVVAGLTNGVAYTFTVTATNGVGNSASSAPSAAVTPFAPLTIPGAPTMGSAVAGNAQAIVSFTPPANTGGGVASYTVTSTPGNRTATGAASPLTVTGLTNGVTYTFVVKATNAAGTSIASAASNAVTPTSALTIASMPFNGNTGMGVAINYTYTTVATINQINVGGVAAASLVVFTDATFTVQDLNWTCGLGCIATTPVPAGTPLYIEVSNNNGGAFNLSVANIIITPSQGATGTPLAITMPFTTGMVGSMADSYYAYTTTGTVNKISSSEPTATTWANATTNLDVFTDASFSVIDPNWRCPAANACFYRGATPIPVGTVLHIRVYNFTNGVGANYTLSASNVVTIPSEGVTVTPLVITMPHAGMVGTFKNSHYSYTTTFTSTTAITMDAMTEDVDPQVFTDATFTLLDPNWVCTGNFGTTPDDCTATTPVSAGTVLYIRAKNFANGVGATFNVSVTGSGIPTPPPVQTVFSISGTVGYAGAKTGSVTVKVANAGNPGFIQWMKNIPAAGAYTVQGLTPGSYVVTAEMDTLNSGAPNASNPRTTTPAAATVSAADVTAVNLSLADPAAPAPVTPTLNRVDPGDVHAMLQFGYPTNASNQEIATAYKVYWGADAATATVGGGTQVIAATGTNGAGVSTVGALSNGAILYFKVSALVGAVESAPSAIYGPITIGAKTGLNTVTGTVSTPGGVIPAGAAMMVGMYDTTSQAIYFSWVANPTTSQNYSVTGVPNGTYYNFVFIDMNANGVMEPGDLTNTNSQPPLVTVTGAATGNLTLSSASATLSVQTQYDAQWTNYGLRVKVTDGAKRVVGVTMLSGPNVVVPSDLAALNNNSGWANLPVTPVVGDSYGFTVFYSDGTSQAMTANVTGVLGAANLPTGLTTSTVAPGASAGVPLFSWVAPVTMPVGATYALGLQSATAGWWISGMPSNQLSVLYNANGSAMTPTLTPGSNGWHIEVNDVFGNTAISQNVTY